MSRSTVARGGRDGQFEVQQHETDSPIFPVAQLERLASFRPDMVDFVRDQTKIEADNRRSENHRVNTLVFIERMSGQLFAFAMGICGIIGGIFTAIRGHENAGIAISVVSIGTLAVVFITKKRNG